MTRTDDGNIRYAYRKNPEPTPRRCIIVGTSDVDTPLPNDSNLSPKSTEGMTMQQRNGR